MSENNQLAPEGVRSPHPDVGADTSATAKTPQENSTEMEDVTKKPEDGGEEGDGEKKEPEEEPRVTASEMFKYADRLDVFLMIVGGICAFIAGGGMPAFSEVFGQLLQELINKPEDIDKVMADLALIMVYIGAGLFFFSFFQVFCWMLAGQRQVARIRLRFFEAVLRQDIAWHDEHKPGELTSRMDGDIRVVQNGINDKFSSGIFQLGMFLFGFGFGFYRSWQLTLVMFGTLPIIAFVGAMMSKVMTEMTEASREHYAKAGEIATEVLENVKTVQVFGREEHEVQRYCTAAGPSQLAGIKREFASTASVGSTYFVLFCSYAIAFYFASYLIEWGDNTVGEITATFFSVLMGSFAVGLMFPSISAFGEARAAAHKVYAIIDRVPQIDIDDEAGIKLESGLKEQITLTNINFAYPTRPDYKLFKDLNLTIQKGKSVAFSGASGCGKSSLIQLIQRFYDPNSGSISIDGVDMRELNLMWWRDQIGIVSQEPSLFSGTIADNVRVGKPDATMEEVISACKKANIHDLVLTLPHKYDTAVGAVGSQLSGGQKQRLAIARAIVKNPAILILDEATSALDRKSEMEVQAALDGIIEAGGLTVIVIAHRLATIRNVDTIYFVMHDDIKGSWIAESGTYDELLALNGHFANMTKRQAVTTKVVEEGADSAAVTPDAHGTSRDRPEDEPKTPLTPLKKDDKEELTPEELAKKEIEETNVPHSRVLKMLFPDCWAVLLGLLGSVITGGLYPAYAVVFANMLEVLGRYADDTDKLRSQTPLWAGLFVAIAVAAFVGWILQAFYAVAGERLTKRLREVVFRAVLRQDAGFFDMPGRDAGAMSGILSGDCEAVHQLWGPSLGLKIQMFCNIGVGLIIALIYQWKLALVTAAGIPAIAIAGAVQQMLLVGFNHQTKDGNSVDSVKSETLTNIRTVTSFNMKRQQAAIYQDISDAASYGVFTNSIVMGIIFGFSQFSFFGVFALSYWYGGQLMKDGEAEFLDIIIASTAVLMGAMGAGEAGGFASKLKDAEMASKRVFFILDREPPIDTQSTTGDKDIGAGCKIDVDLVKFRYPARPDAKILRGLSTTFQTASVNGLMGQTGCGKSTIIQLLSRFYEYQGGINVNGKDLNSLDVSEWRKSISIVLQEPALFSGSVMENIKYSRGEATDEEVFAVARLAAIHDDILLMPNGYDTDVGYKGRALSGGQKQRVAIARGLLRNPRLLLLDEATSALDNATEGRVQKGIEAAHKANPMTIISVAHRLTTIREADKIVLMDGGVIIEEGSHDELMAMDGQYKERWELYQQSTE